MKKLYTTLAFALLAISIYAQTPNISITTTLSINSQITIGLSGNASSTPIQIDWGNGVKENFTIGETEEFFGYPVKGSTINIWGAGITGLNIQSKSITALTFFEATNLKWLFCKNNQITTLNLNGCSALTFVECKQNLISNLTLPNTTTLTYVDCSDNNLTLLTLPTKQAIWTDYIYSPQKDYALAKTVYTVNEEIDLSSQLNINGNTTTYVWKTAGGATLVNGVDYNAAGGKFTFLKTYSESIYCEMANSTFPSLTLKTFNLDIIIAPLVEMTTTMSVGSTFSFTIAPAESNTAIQVDFGDGQLQNFSLGTNGKTITGTLVGSKVLIFGNDIRSLFVSKLELTTLNVSNCPKLGYLICQINNIETLNLSKNTLLEYLSCDNNQLTALDISKNSLLWNLSCDNNKIKILDASNLSKLERLRCFDNNITSLNVSNCIALEELFCSSNQIQALNIQNTNDLKEFGCQNNYLTLKTLPLRQQSWTTYYYAPQKAYKLDKTDYAIDEEIDLSDQLNINGILTEYLWKTISGKTLIKDVDYVEVEGNFKFLLAQADFIFCQMKNASFPGLTLETETISITSSNPCVIMTTNMAIGSNFTFRIELTKDSNIQVDWGNGSLTNHSIGTSALFVSGTLTGNTIKIYGVGIKFLDIFQKGLTAIDVTNCTVLDEFYCYYNTELTNLDISKNIALTNLICSSNKLTTLDVTKNIALKHLSCGSNSLTSLDVSNNTLLKSLSCYSNELTSLDVLKNIALSELNCEDNQLTNLDLTMNTSLTDLYCAENHLTVIDVSKNTALAYFYCNKNYLTFNTLPFKLTSWFVYNYYPQSKIKLEKKQYNLSETVDLSSQLTSNGNTTTYIWNTKGGTTLLSGTDYNITGGVTTFLKGQTDSVYCQMTNATFPALTLSTTNIKVSDPTSIDSEFAQTTKVYPNPVSNLLWVVSEEAIKRVEIYTIVGTKVFDQDYNNTQKVNINSVEFPKGLLIIKVYGMNGVIEKKILKE